VRARVAASTHPPGVSKKKANGRYGVWASHKQRQVAAKARYTAMHPPALRSQKGPRSATVGYAWRQRQVWRQASCCGAWRFKHARSGEKVMFSAAVEAPVLRLIGALPAPSPAPASPAWGEHAFHHTQHRHVMPAQRYSAPPATQHTNCLSALSSTTLASALLQSPCKRTRRSAEESSPVVSPARHGAPNMPERCRRPRPFVAAGSPASHPIIMHAVAYATMSAPAE